MPRTSVSEVTSTIDTTLDDATISEWLELASELVDDIEERGSLEDARLKMIERLVAQHFLAAQDPRLQSINGPVFDLEYEGETGEGMKATQYGQRALMLDPTGVLADAMEAEHFTLGV